MKKQINIALLIIFLFIGWLFYNTAKTSQLNLKSLKLKYEDKKKIRELKQSDIERAQYQMIEATFNDKTAIFIYDIKSGATFKLNETADGVKWMPIGYNFDK
ncbi:MAG: hypothetical protein PHV17_04710 [Candidatus Omnitrophica bacterium]|nr:hypothetical protein [Candidatus Omnitrophota bacterium]